MQLPRSELRYGEDTGWRSWHASPTSHLEHICAGGPVSVTSSSRCQTACMRLRWLRLHMLHATPPSSLTQPHAGDGAWSTRHATRVRRCQLKRCPRSLLSERGTAEDVSELPGGRFSSSHRPLPHCHCHCHCQVSAKAENNGIVQELSKRVAQILLQALLQESPCFCPLDPRAVAGFIRLPVFS